MGKRHIEVTPEMDQEIVEEIVEDTLEANGVKLCLRDTRDYHFPNDTNINVYDFDNTQELEQAIIEEYSKEMGDIHIETVFLYDHSGLAIQTFPQSRWDSSFLGFAFGVRREGETDQELSDRVNEGLQMFGDSVSGQVYSVHLVEEVTCECCGHTELEYVFGNDFVFGSRINGEEEIINLVKQEQPDLEDDIEIKYL